MISYLISQYQDDYFYNINRSNEKISSSKIKHIKVAICCIAKMENDYIKEFVEYHKTIGIDKIIIYDNNDIDGEKFDKVLKPYIKSKYVIIENYRGIKTALVKSYNDCYKKYSKKFDWIAFIDVDEFIHLNKKFLNIQEFVLLNKFNNVQGIRLCWKQYDDSGQIKPTKDLSIKRFKTFLPFNFYSVSSLTKIILKTNIDNLKITSPHGPVKNKKIKCMNSIAEPCKNAIEINNPTWEDACVHHYRFRTIHEYVMNKMVRLWPTNYGNGGKTMLNLDFFFKFNEYTKEKYDYAMNLIKKYNIDENKE